VLFRSGDFSSEQGYIPAENITVSPGLTSDSAFRTDRTGRSRVPGLESEALLPADAYHSPAKTYELPNSSTTDNKHIRKKIASEFPPDAVFKDLNPDNSNTFELNSLTAILLLFISIHIKNYT
jgi:hypothetical protein